MVITNSAEMTLITLLGLKGGKIMIEKSEKKFGVGIRWIKEYGIAVSYIPNPKNHQIEGLISWHETMQKAREFYLAQQTPQKYLKFQNVIIPKLKDFECFFENILNILESVGFNGNE